MDGIILLVDSTYQTRFEESKIEHGKLLSNEDLSTIPIAILGNKIKRMDAATEDMIV